MYINPKRNNLRKCWKDSSGTWYFPSLKASTNTSVIRLWITSNYVAITL